MSRSPQSDNGCPSWENLVRFVTEGGPWPVRHLRTCARCRKRRALLEQLVLLQESAASIPPARGCPDIADLVALSGDELSASQRYEIGEHLCECESCAALLREIGAVEADEEQDWEVREPRRTVGVLPSDAGGRPGLRRRTTYLVRAVALLLLGLGLAAVVLSPFPAIDSGASARWRGPVPALRAEVTWPEGDNLPTVSWSDWDGAESFRVRVWSETGQRLFERHVAADGAGSIEIAIEEAEATDVVVWQVDALKSGEVLSSSGPAELRWQRR